MAVPSIPNSVVTSVPNGAAPWNFSPEVTERLKVPKGAQYVKVEITPDVPEYKFVRDHFDHSAPVNRIITRVWAIHNPTQRNAFETALVGMEAESTNPAFHPTWEGEPNANLRHFAFERWKQISRLFNPLSVPLRQPDGIEQSTPIPNITILPQWHGTSRARAESVCGTGHTFFGLDATDLLNDGHALFGNGMYFTNSAAYANIYSRSDILLLSWVAMRPPYPVINDQPIGSTQEPTDITELRGRGARGGYNAHYIPVTSVRNDPPLFYPCTNGQIAEFDELVVFRQTQALPAFWVEIAVGIIPNPLLLLQAANIQEISEVIIRRAEGEMIERRKLVDICVQLREALKVMSGRAPLPEIAFGALKWKQYFGIKVKEPPLPYDIHGILASKCPFFPDQEERETHFLKLVPEGMTLEQLKDLTLNPVQGFPIGLRGNDDYVRKTFSEYGQRPSGRAHWVLMPKEVIPGSTEQTWENQQMMSEQYKSLGYGLLSFIDGAFCLLLEYVEKRERHYCAHQWKETYCVEKVADKWPVAIGGFSEEGLRISYSLDSHNQRSELHGLGLARLFY